MGGRNEVAPSRVVKCAINSNPRRKRHSTLELLHARLIGDLWDQNFADVRLFDRVAPAGLSGSAHTATL
jgi:hypothetical protein